VAVARYFFAKDKAEFALYGDLASGYMAYFTLGAFSGSAEIRIASIIASLVIVACTIDSSTRLAKTLGKIFAPIAILCFLLVLLGMGLRS
jgi:ethanolamine transporter EutH